MHPLLVALPTFLPAFLASPWENPSQTCVYDAARTNGISLFLGNQNPGPRTLAWRQSQTEGCTFPPLTPTTPPAFELQTGLYSTIEAGNLVSNNAGGWTAPGMLTVSTTPWASVGYGVFHARFAPEVGLGVPVEPTLRIRDAWVGVDTGQGRLGFGKEQRWIGPGHFGTLLLSDNALPPWMGTASGELTLPGKAAAAGKFRAEVGAGLLDQPRTDVENPGLLLMDFRYLPIPYLEIGLGRMSVFGGKDRPPVDLGQLILPTEPHIYEDPDQLLPDQNELARIDVRLTLPVQKWAGGPVRYIEGWWEYGGEDVIAKDYGVIPMPVLAGVGNLYGGEVAVGPVTVTGEYSKLMDDYFRWYVGHRVYHEGFTQGGRVLGHFGGTDSETLTLGLAVQRGGFRARASGGTIRQVGVIEAFNDHLFALMVEEHRSWGRMEAGLSLPKAYLQVEGTAEKATGIDYIPGNDATSFQVGFSVSVPLYQITP